MTKIMVMPGNWDDVKKLIEEDSKGKEAKRDDTPAEVISPENWSDIKRELGIETENNAPPAAAKPKAEGPVGQAGEDYEKESQELFYAIRREIGYDGLYDNAKDMHPDKGTVSNALMGVYDLLMDENLNGGTLAGFYRAESKKTLKQIEDRIGRDKTQRGTAGLFVKYGQYKTHLDDLAPGGVNSTLAVGILAAMLGEKDKAQKLYKIAKEDGEIDGKGIFRVWDSHHQSSVSDTFTNAAMGVLSCLAGNVAGAEKRYKALKNIDRYKGNNALYISSYGYDSGKDQWNIIDNAMAAALMVMLGKSGEAIELVRAIDNESKKDGYDAGNGLRYGKETGPNASVGMAKCLLSTSRGKLLKFMDTSKLTPNATYNFVHGDPNSSSYIPILDVYQ